MDVLVDTNILLRSADPGHQMHGDAVNAVNALRQRGEHPCVASQNLVEFRTVCTRPMGVNGLGMVQAEATTEIARLKALFHVLPEEAGILAEWERLVDTYGAVGKQNHDARIVAAMAVHGVSRILTFNKDDFARYPGITVMVPKDVLAGRTAAAP